MTRSLRPRKLVAWAAQLGVLVAAFVAVSAFQARGMLATDRRPAPELRAPTLAGEVQDLGASAGRPVLVYFFAPWCRVCGASADNLARLRRLVDERALAVVTVALDWQSETEVREYVRRHGLEGPVLLASRQVASDWQVYAFPTYYVLDSQHRVVRRDLGYSTQLGLLWRVLTVD